MAIDVTTRNSSDVIMDIKRTFGDESGVQITDSDIIRWINKAQLEITMRNPELGQAVALINVTSGQSDYPLLANIPNVLSIQSLHYNGRPVEHLEFQEAEAFLMKGVDEPILDTNSSNGYAEFWYERGGVVTIYPVPGKDITNGIKVYFNKRPADITSSSQVLSVSDNYYNAVISFVLEQAYLLDENVQLAGVVAQKFEQGIAQMKERTQTQTDYYPFITQVEEW